MKNNWAEWAIRHRQVVYFFAALLTVMGIYCYAHLGRSEDPNYAVKTMVVSAAWPGATPRQVEQHVTDKIEKVIQNVADIDYIKSYSRAGVSVIMVYLKEEVRSENVQEHWQDLRNLVSDASREGEFPSDMYGPYFNDHFDDVFGNVYAVTSKDFSYEEIRKVASRIKDAFVQVKDVKKVELVGVQPEKIYIEVSNDKLAQLGMSVDSLAQTIGAETAVTPGGMLHDAQSNTYLRLTGLPDAVQDIENLPLSGNGRTVRLGDIARVRRGFPEPMEPKMYYNGQPAVGIALSMEDGGNNMEMGEALDKKITELRELLPLGFELEKVSDQPRVVKNSIGEFMESLIEAVLIVLAVSLFTMGRQSGYVISLCIPLVLMCSFVGMYLMGIDLHKISLGSLIVSLGMLVDDSVVVVEMIEVKVKEGWERVKACSYAFESCARPLLTGTMITVCSFMPIAFAKGDVGDYAGSLFAVIGVTLMSSWLISATLAPTLGYEWILPPREGKNAEAEEKPDAKKLSAESDEGKKITAEKVIAAQTDDPENNPLYQNAFYAAFKKILRWSLARRKFVLFLGALCLVFSALLTTQLRQEFFPGSVRPELLVEMNLPDGASLAHTDELARAATQELLKDEDVSYISTHVGESVPRFVLVLEPEQPRDNYAQLVVVAKGLDARRRLEKKVSDTIEKMFPEVQCYSRSIPLGPPSPYPVMYRVSAPTDALAKEYAGKLRELMLQNPNVTVIRYDWMEKTRAVQVEIDDDKLRQMGLTRKTVASALQAEISGYTVSQYYEGDQALDMVFRLDPLDYTSVEDVGALSIPTQKGAVQLRQVAKIGYANEDGLKYRRNLLPTVTVYAGISDDYTGNDVSNQIWEASRGLRESLPYGVSVEVGGPTEKSQKALGYILAPVPAMLVIMLMLLMIQVKDLKKLLVIAATAPFGFVGVALGLFLTNTPLGVMAEIGALALVGTIIRNSTVLVDQIDQHLAQGMTPYKAVTSSVIVRFRPIMLTALTTVLGLIPMFPSDFWRGMAIALSAGLTVATLITLVLLPVLYCLAFKVGGESE